METAVPAPKEVDIEVPASLAVDQPGDNAELPTLVATEASNPPTAMEDVHLELIEEAIAETAEAAAPIALQADLVTSATEITTETPVVESNDIAQATEPAIGQSESEETDTKEMKSAEEVRAEELAARSIARIEAEAAAQVRARLLFTG
jgi:hypothetical protein